MNAAATYQPALAKVGRWAIEIRRGEQPVGPCGHPIKRNSIILQHGILTCRWVPRRGHAPCDRSLYLLLRPDGRQLLAEVTAAEVQRMGADQMTVEEIYIFLTSAGPRR